MAARNFNDRMAQERRARLQAEQLLALRSEELYNANRKLAVHADALSTQVIEQREENALLKGKTTKTEAQLEVATERAVTAQRRLWDALTATEDGFAIFDRDWRLVAANPAFFKIFDGVADVTEGASYEAILRIAVEEGIIDLQGVDPDEWVDRMIARWEMTPIPRVDIKLWNGAYIRLNDKQTPQGDFVSLAVDITPNIRRERQLRSARDAALGASRAKSAFLANMSHEIRTPMNGVVSMAEVLRETELDEEQQIYADTIKNSGEALLVIINDILDFSKIEAGKLELHNESFDLNATVREIFRLLQPGLEGKDIELRLDYDIFLPAQMIGDRGRIRQILTNLIGNAVKFTEAGSVTVRVLAGPPAEEIEDLNISIVVEDTGVGIAPEKQDHVFGEFNQVEDEANRRHDGTGLGLAITHRLVGLMGGEMWLESEVGRGSVFGVKICLKKDPVDDQAPVAGLPVDQSRILVIGRGGEGEEGLLDALGRLHAETSLVRRVPTERDLEGTTALILCDDAIDVAGVTAALDKAGFAGPRLSSARADAVPDGFEGCVFEQGLAALRTQLLQPQVALSIAADEVREAPVAAVADPPVADSPAAQSRTRPRLLAAEDNKTNRLVFKTMLKGLDLDLEIATNGRELVDAYKRDVPDLVMTDISMPEMDGLEAAKLIRAFEAENGLPRVTIIAMTAHALDGDRERILAAGLDDYITKPLKKAVIQSKVTDGLALS
ncbi:MAG: response regulator [Roseicyclus sp.]|nr:response regulator [Roseicyclus sp.]